jgi:hypothetical protein
MHTLVLGHARGLCDRMKHTCSSMRTNYASRYAFERASFKAKRPQNLHPADLFDEEEGKRDRERQSLVEMKLLTKQVHIAHCTLPCTRGFLWCMFMTRFPYAWLPKMCPGDHLGICLSHSLMLCMQECGHMYIYIYIYIYIYYIVPIWMRQQHIRRRATTCACVPSLSPSST